MILKTNNNDNFTLTLKIDITYSAKYIEFLVILNNLKNHKQQLKIFKAEQFKQALEQYEIWEQFIF